MDDKQAEILKAPLLEGRLNDQDVVWFIGRNAIKDLGEWMRQKLDEVGLSEDFSSQLQGKYLEFIGVRAAEWEEAMKGFWADIPPLHRDHVHFGQHTELDVDLRAPSLEDEQETVVVDSELGQSVGLPQVLYPPGVAIPSRMKEIVREATEQPRPWERNYPSDRMVATEEDVEVTSVDPENDIMQDPLATDPQLDEEPIGPSPNLARLLDDASKHNEPPPAPDSGPTGMLAEVIRDQVIGKNKRE